MTTALHKVVSDSIELSPLTIKRYLNDLTVFTSFVGDSPANWNKLMFGLFLTKLKEQGLKVSSINRVLATLKFASWRWSKIQKDPSLDFADGASSHGVMSEDDARAWLSTCKENSPIDLRDRAMFVLGVETGMKRRALCSLQLGNIKLMRDCTVAHVAIHEGDRLSPIPLSPTALKALQPWREWLAANKKVKGAVFRSLTKRATKTVGMRWEVGESISEQGVYKTVVSRGTACNISSVRPNVFHDTFISWRLDAGCSLRSIAVMTGAVDFDPALVCEATPAWLKLLIEAA